jgi:hypothetical protein
MEEQEDGKMEPLQKMVLFQVEGEEVDSKLLEEQVEQDVLMFM